MAHSDSSQLSALEYSSIKHIISIAQHPQGKEWYREQYNKEF